MANEMKEFTMIKKDPVETGSVVHLNVSNSMTNPAYTPGGPPSISSSPRLLATQTFESNSLGKFLYRIQMRHIEPKNDINKVHSLNRGSIKKN